MQRSLESGVTNFEPLSAVEAICIPPRIFPLEGYQSLRHRFVNSVGSCHMSVPRVIVLRLAVWMNDYALLTLFLFHAPVSLSFSQTSLSLLKLEGIISYAEDIRDGFLKRPVGIITVGAVKPLS
jgi:hypothetical protein